MIKTPTLKVSGLDEKVMESKEDAHKPFKSSLEEDNNEKPKLDPYSDPQTNCDFNKFRQIEKTYKTEERDKIDDQYKIETTKFTETGNN